MGELKQTEQTLGRSSDARGGARHAQLFALLRQGSLDGAGAQASGLQAGRSDNFAPTSQAQAQAQATLPQTSFASQAAQSFERAAPRDGGAPKAADSTPAPITAGKGILKRLYPKKLARAALAARSEAG
ncbi:hypothetical protein [Litorivita sp. NS0012-18]|uniref:hypothetical protein n=1 Tax=Litorivita sp. NS0012-18 TaxID=3127655 RepID=UPI00310BDA30